MEDIMAGYTNRNNIIKAQAEIGDLAQKFLPSSAFLNGD